MLHKYGIENPETGLAGKIVGYQFSQKIDVVDPYTRKKDKKHMKPFMVNNSVNLFEKCKIILDPTDKGLITQLEEYRVKSISSSGLPIYSDDNDHAVDALNMALLLFEQKYGELLKKVYSIKTMFIGTLDTRETNVLNRDLDNKEVPVVKVIKTSGKEGIISISPTKRRNKRANLYQRRSF